MIKIPPSLLRRAASVTLGLGAGFFVGYLAWMFAGGRYAVVWVGLLPWAMAVATVAVLEEGGIARIPYKAGVCLVAWGAGALALVQYQWVVGLGASEAIALFIIPWLCIFFAAAICITALEQNVRGTRGG